MDKILNKEVRKGAAVLFVFAFLATAFIGVGFESSAAQPPVFKTMNLSNDANTASDPSIWNVGSHVFVAWTEGSHGVFFRESPDNGTTWVPAISSPALKISTHSGTTQYPLISANGSDVYVTWSQTTGTGTFLQVWFAASTNNGQSFSSAVQLSNTTDPNGAITPVIASWGSFVVVGWTANSTSFVTTSSDGGKTWNLIYNIPASFHEPQVAAWGIKNAYIVSDRGYAYTHDSGVTWNNLTANTDVHSEPWVWPFASNVYLVGEGKHSTSQIMFTHSSDNGTTFAPVVNISSTLSDAWGPMLWAYGNNVWVAYHNNPGGPGGQEYIQTSHDNGSTFSPPVSLSGPGLTLGFPFTIWSSDGHNVWAGWPQEIGSTGNWMLRVAYSTDGGNTWTSPPGLNASLNSVGQASNQNDVATGAISAFGQTVFASYEYIPTSGVAQIYFSTATIPAVVTSTTTTSSTTTTTTTSTSTTSSTTTSTTSSTTSSTTKTSTTSSTTTSVSTSNCGACTMTGSPNPVISGQTLKITGSGFPANTNMTIQWNSKFSTAKVSVITSPTGTFTTSLIAPKVTSSGTHTVYAIKTLTNTQIKQINVVVNP